MMSAPRSAANPARVAAGQVRRHDRFIHPAEPSLIARQDRRGPFCRSEQRGARHGQGHRPAGPGQRARLGAVAVPAPYFCALIRPRPQRGAQLLVDGRLDGELNVLVDQLTQRGSCKLQCWSVRTRMLMPSP
jgi:hypothetical protein